MKTEYQLWHWSSPSACGEKRGMYQTAEQARTAAGIPAEANWDGVRRRGSANGLAEEPSLADIRRGQKVYRMLEASEVTTLPGVRVLNVEIATDP